MDHESAHVSDLADQPDDPKVTIALSAASMSINRRIQSTGDTLAGPAARKGFSACSLGQKQPRAQRRLRVSTRTRVRPAGSDSTGVGSDDRSVAKALAAPDASEHERDRPRLWPPAHAWRRFRASNRSGEVPPAAGRFAAWIAPRSHAGPRECRARTRGSLICGHVPDCAWVRRCSQRLPAVASRSYGLAMR